MAYNLNKNLTTDTELFSDADYQTCLTAIVNFTLDVSILTLKYTEIISPQSTK